MPQASTITRPSGELLGRARSGDEEAFADLLEPYRPELHAHCYRMLGSYHDAEDALQDTLTKAWRGLSGLADGARLRPWLYKIATNTCLDASGRRSNRVMVADISSPTSAEAGIGEPITEVLWVEPYPDEQLGLRDGFAGPEARYEQREAVELAFIAALQHLPANQRAVLIMREVLGYSAREVAESLETTVASVNSALQRARKAIDERLPEQSQQATLRSLGDERVQEIVERYADAWDRNDIDALTELLAEDASFAMPPYPVWWSGRDTLLDVKVRVAPKCPESRYLPTQANGQPALAWYSRDEQGAFVASVLEVISLEGERVKEVTAFVTPEALRWLGLPDRLP
jgi:RNA polymerase sigma-70 factor, ECF subfamily